MHANPSPKPIRDRGFIKRLEIACENHPRCPTGHGRQRWIRDEITTHFKLTLSPEAVSKWFSGASRPNLETMRFLARVLEVDEAWLSLGKTPELTPTERKRHMLFADGSVNMVAGMIQMSGGQVAFNEDTESPVDFFAIIGGKHHAIKVVSVTKQEGERMLFVIPKDSARIVVLGVIGSSMIGGFQVLRLTPELIEKHGKRKGTYFELWLDRTPPGFSIGRDKVAPMTSFNELSA